MENDDILHRCVVGYNKELSLLVVIFNFGHVVESVATDLSSKFIGGDTFKKLSLLIESHSNSQVLPDPFQSLKWTSFKELKQTGNKICVSEYTHLYMLDQCGEHVSDLTLYFTKLLKSGLWKSQTN